jgi:hypothetical protein
VTRGNPRPSIIPQYFFHSFEYCERLGHDLFGKFLHFLAGDRSHFVAAFFRFRFQLGIFERAGKGAENCQPIESDTTSQFIICVIRRAAE